MSFCLYLFFPSAVKGQYNFLSFITTQDFLSLFNFYLIFFSLGSGERERDDLRDERHRDRARQRNIDRAAPERRSKLERGRERDVSEQIALGIPAKTAGASGEGLFDSRLFNQSRGLSSGIFF